MKFTVLISIFLFNMQIPFVTDFDANSTTKWYIVNDGVMGGLSEGSFTIENSVALFSGNVSLDNNGGFTSVRASVDSDSFKNSSKIIIRVKGDGKSYQFRIRTDDNFDGVSYSCEFKTKDYGEWEEIILNYTDFKAGFRGYKIPNAPKIDSSKIKQIGFLIGNKKEEKFRLEIDWIKVD